MVDELLSLILGKSTLVQVALDINIEECRDTTYRHRSTILSLHCSEVTEVQPLNSLASVLSWLADIVAIQLSHLLQALESLDLHRNLFTKTDYIVNHLTVTHISEVVLLLLNKEIDTIESYTAVVTYDTSTTVCIRQTSEDMVMAHEFHLWSVSIKHAVVVSFAILVENLMKLL